MNLFINTAFDEASPLLYENETNHCKNVLRKNKGDEIFVTDGKGSIFKCSIIDFDKKSTNLKVIEKSADYKPRNYKLHIAIAPTKNISRFEWFLEKATEAGIDLITPIICKKSERKIIKQERLEKIIDNAVKQSFSAYKPELNDLISLKDFLINRKESVKLIAHCHRDREKIFITDSIKSGYSDYLVLIGPEGDFTIDEIKSAANNNFIETSLGNSRLRTETAGLAACFAMSLTNT